MLFNSLQFLLFFIVVTIAYFQVPHKLRWLLLLSASVFFYMVFIPIYMLIIASTIIIDYFAGIYIEKNTGIKRKVFLILSLFANIGILAVFKYYNFIIENLNFVVHNFSDIDGFSLLKIALPVGLSFHTFQAMSYTIEVYRGNQKSERHFGIYALYVMFYPQLVAGPIERPQNLIHQFREIHHFDYERFKQGISLMAFGLFKKVVIADRLSMAVDFSYQHTENQSGISLFIATIFYSFQIYCDFSGYSDMAIGAAKIMGFKLMDNFRTPYFSASISEFWKRWHISLSTWFKDYLYIPLGGNRVKTGRMYLNIFIVFLLSGLWHGASWNFIIWGAIHGFLLISSSVLVKILPSKFLQTAPNFKKIAGIFFTFFLVNFSWIFFRAKDINQAILVIKKIFLFEKNQFDLGMNPNELIFSGLLILALLVKERYWYNIQTPKNYIFYGVNLLILLACYFFGVFNQKQFIYFQF